ncbi:MAG: hypothetical protein ACYS67_04875 [Planctomycetota bacterium]|jgi:hypothetical protein
MSGKPFYTLSFGFAFSFQSLIPRPSPLNPALSTFVESALQIDPFLTNKANFPKNQMNLNNLLTMDYENWILGQTGKTNPIQTQYKANSKPIQSQTNPISPPQKPFLKRYF